MTHIKLRCDGQVATAKADGPIAEGTVNIPVEITLIGYDGYTPKLVAKCGTEERDMVVRYDGEKTTSEIPHECLMPGRELLIGIDAFRGNERMPSIMAKVGKVDPSPAGLHPQRSVVPTPDIVDQITEQAGEAERKAESALTEAREAIRKADEVSGTAEEAKSDAEAAKRTAENVAGSVQTLLSAYDTGGIVTGTTMKKVDGGIELRVEYKGKSYTMTADGFAMEAEVRQMISTIPKFKIEVVQSLPESDIDTSTLYLVPADPRQKDDVYTEWIYAGGKWEKLGTQSVDLSEYARKDEIPEPYDDSEIKREQSEIKEDLTRKVGYSEVVNGQLLMYSDATKEHLLATLDLPVANGTDVLGIVKANSTYGVQATPSGRLITVKAPDAAITSRNDSYRPIVPANVVTAVNSVLCSTAPTEQLTAEQRTAARQRIGVEPMSVLAEIDIAPHTATTVINLPKKCTVVDFYITFSAARSKGVNVYVGPKNKTGTGVEHEYRSAGYSMPASDLVAWARLWSNGTKRTASAFSRSGSNIVYSRQRTDYPTAIDDMDGVIIHFYDEADFTEEAHVVVCGY